MLESESSALPFGDIPLLRTMAIIHDDFYKCKYFFEKIENFKIKLIEESRMNNNTVRKK